MWLIEKRLPEEADSAKRDKKDYFPIPARIWLRIAFMTRDKKRAIMRRYQERIFNRRGRSRQYILADDDTTYLSLRFLGGGVWHNQADFTRRANERLDAWIEENLPKTPASAMYAGFVPIELSGLIESVRWSVSSSGHATTRASLGREDIGFFGPGRRELRHIDKIQNRMARAERRREARRAQHQREGGPA